MNTRPLPPSRPSYIAEGTRLKAILNRRGYSIPLTLYAWWLKIRLNSCIFWSVLIVNGGNTQNGYVAEGTINQTTLNRWWYRSSDAVCMVIEDSFSFLHLMVRFNRRTSNHSEYSVAWTHTHFIEGSFGFLHFMYILSSDDSWFEPRHEISNNVAFWLRSSK